MEKEKVRREKGTMTGKEEKDKQAKGPKDVEKAKASREHDGLAMR